MQSYKKPSKKQKKPQSFVEKNQPWAFSFPFCFTFQNLFAVFLSKYWLTVVKRH